MHTGVKIGIALVLVIIAATAAMALSRFCPPAGPWPQPPWCENPGGFNPVLTAGTRLSPGVEAALPATSDPVTLIVNGNSLPMTRVSDYYYSLPGIDLVSGDTLTYRFASGDRQTPQISAVVNRNETLRAGLAWTETPVVTRPGFIKGHAVMDAGGYIINAVRSGAIDSTYAAMQEDGGEWTAFDYYWTYTNYSAPEIVDEGDLVPTHARADDIARMAQLVHARGMKFFLITELEWNVLPGEAPGLSGDAYYAYLNDKWAKGQAFDAEMGRRLTQTPGDPAVQAYWDRWFAQFEPFMLKAAKVSEDNHVEMLALGKQLNGAMNPGNEKRWRDLVAKVRAVYHGKITQVVYTAEGADLAGTLPWADALDCITLYDWTRFSAAEHPSVDELSATMKRINRDRFDPLYRKFGKPLVFLLPFQSRDHAAEQQWFEPMATAPTVREDLMAQADLYEAFFRSTLDEPWNGGVITWGYWIEPGFNPAWSFEKSSSVRGKPASLVIRSWFARVRG